MIGSSNAGLAIRAAFLNAMDPAILNAISLESTSWQEPAGEDRPHVDEGVAGDDTTFHRLLDPGVDRGDVLPRDVATLDLVDELVATTRAGRLEVDDDVAVLAPAAGLADVALLDVLDRLGDRLAVRHLRLAHVGDHVRTRASSGRPAPRGAARPCPR